MGHGNIRIFSATLAASCLIASAAFAKPGPQEDRPAWERPENGIRLLARDVIADPSVPLPELGGAFYLFTTAAPTRSELAEIGQVGLRYLGFVGDHCYILRRESLNEEQQLQLLGWDKLIGTALTEPQDRLGVDALDLARAGALPLRPFAVTLWPKTTVGEAMKLLRADVVGLRLPADESAEVAEERFVLVEPSQETLERLSNSPFVASIAVDAEKQAYNATSRALARANAVKQAPYNLDGSGVVVGHWDGGSVSTGHADFDGRVTNYENRGTDSHATHTAGTILGSGASRTEAAGYAPEATMVAYDFYGNPAGERREAKHNHYHEHDNHSWGSVSSAYGSYDNGAQSFDLDGRDLLLFALKAAGNDGRSSQTVVQGYGFDSLPPDSTGKNVLVIGATNDEGDLTGFSSRGPTNDGRVKPDICANGDGVFSTLPSGRHGSMSGTSMATPSVTGGITLLAQLYRAQNADLRWAHDHARAVLIHTSVDVFHPGPDYRHGWGNMDVQAAADMIIADAAEPGRIIVRGAVREGETEEYPLEVPPGLNQLKVTLSWLDAFQNSTQQRVLIHDLDLVLISPSGTEEFPFTLDPSNPFDDAVRTVRNERDNVEQVRLSNPEAGTWTVRVVGTSIGDPNLNVQGYVIASDLPIDRSVERLSAPATSIPDNSMAGTDLTFNTTDTRELRSLRLRLEIKHPARGNLRVDMIHPDGTSVNVEVNDQSTRRDIYAIYPDLRSYDDDVNSFYGRSAAGTWTVRVADLNSGQTGEVLRAELELEFEGVAAPPVNTPPLADAGKDEEVMPLEMITLDGSLSSDPDGDPLTYEWTQSSGTLVTMTGADTVMPTFNAPDSPAREELRFRLTVRDGRGGSATDDVLITVVPENPQTPNQPPIAVAGPDQAVELATTFMVDGSASTDPEGEALTYNWSQVRGEAVTIEDGAQPTLTLLAPTVEGEVVLRLEVRDPQGAVDVDDVMIVVAADPGQVILPEPMNPNPMNPETPQNPGRALNGGSTVGGCGCTAQETESGLGGFLLLLVLPLLRRRRRSWD